MAWHGKTFWLAVVLAAGTLLPVRAGEVFDDDDEKVSEVAPALAGVNDRYKTRNQPVDMRNVVRLGERLRYQVKSTMLSMPLGTIELSCRRPRTIHDRLAYVLRMETRPNESIIKLLPIKFPVQTTVITNIDADTGRSLIYSCHESAANGAKTREESITFNYEQISADPAVTLRDEPIAETLRDRLRGGKREVRLRKYPIPGDMQDALSMIYYGRGLPLEKSGDSVNLLVGGMSDIAEVTLRVLGEESVAVPGFGRFDCLVVQPSCQGDARLASFKGAAKVWLEKSTRIPVKIQLDLDVSLTALLNDVDDVTKARLQASAK